MTGPKTTYNNYDAFGRVGEIDNLDSSGTMVGKNVYTYYSSEDMGAADYQNASAYANTRTLLDNYGRHSRTAVANGQGSNPWYQQDTCYDANGNASFQAYSYQGTGWGTAKVCSGNGDSYSYDALGRVTKITHADGTSVTYAYTGRAMQVTDENLVSRIMQVDGLGRTTAVCELSITTIQSDSPSACGLDIAGTGFLTNYAYDLANNKTTIQQFTSQGILQQQRVFQTDWLGRPILTQEPERGQTTYSYAYNSTGLQVTRKRPQANQGNVSVLTTTTTQYDAVGRILNIQYDDGTTPTKNFSYDAATGWQNYNLGASKGRLTSASISGAGTMYAYNAVGQVTETAQCQPSGCGNDAANKWSSYTYDWLGNVQTAGNGDGITTTYNSYTPANEVGKITSSLSDATHPGTIVSSIVYGPFGPLSWSLGNELNVWHPYDGLGRPQGEWVCTGAPSVGCGDAGGPNEIHGVSVAWSGSRVSLSDEHNNQGYANPMDGDFGYDEFNRLTSLTNHFTHQLLYTYAYDRYGNRWSQNALNGGSSSSLSFDKTTNRINTAGFAYDAAGNLTNDSFHSYTYDAEGNVTQVDGGATAKYTYNALNQRVRMEQAGLDTQEFVFNLNGQRSSYWDVTAGYEIQGQTYWGTKPVEFYEASVAHFQHQDWEGTERMRTTYNGTTEGAFYSLPFGDGYALTGANNDQYHFAGLDFDYNSNTDHAQFRQYSHEQGRWHSPDPYDSSYDLSNPQSFNRYSYVLNNPLSFTDPSGMVYNGSTGGGGGCDITCLVVTAGIGALIGGLEDLFGGGPHFHGSLKPRPEGTGNPDWANADGSFGETLGLPSDVNWSQINPGIAGALGLPDAGCEFGACGAGPSTFSQGPGAIALGGAATIGCILAEPCGAVEGILAGIAVAGTVIGAADIVHQMSDNVRANRQFAEAVRRISRRCGRKLTKDEERRLHDEITKQGFGLDEIEEIGVGMFCPGN